MDEVLRLVVGVIGFLSEVLTFTINLIQLEV